MELGASKEKTLQKIQECGFLSMLLGTLCASVLGKMLTANSVLRAGKVVVRAGRGYNNVDHIDKNFYFGCIL